MTIRLSARTASGSKAKLSRTTSVSTTLTGSDLGAILAVDSTPGTPIVITVPASPVIDDIYYLLDAKSNWGTTPITLSTALYYGKNETFILDQNATLITLIWRGGSIGWTVGVDTASQDNTQLSNLFAVTAPKANPVFTGLVDADGATGVLVPTPTTGSNDKKAVNTEYLNTVLATQDGLPVSRTTTSSFTFVAGDKYKYVLADTSSGNSFTGTLPTTGMVVGEWYGIVDISRTWDSVPVTIATALIQGQTQDASLDSAGDVIKIQWLGAPVGWMFMDGGVSLDPATLNKLFAGKADLISPVFTGNPTVPTPGAGDDSNLISSTAFVARAIRENTSPPVSRTVSTTTATVISTDKNKTIAVDTAANAVTLTLPTTGQTVGDQYHFLDVKANWDTTPATLASAVFFGTTQTFTLNMAGTRVTATWQGLPIGWTVGNSNVSYDAAAINQMLTQVTNNIALPISRITSTSTTVVSTDKNKTVAVDTSAGSAIVLTLPTTGLIDGDQYGFLDAKNTWGATTPSFASATFFGTTQTIELDQGGGLVVATWRGATLGWTLSAGAAMYDSTTLQTLFQTKADTAYVDAAVFAAVNPAPEPLQLGPSPVNMPAQSGTPISASYAGKKRLLDWAGFPGKYFFRSGTMHITNVEFGTRTADTPSNTSLSAYVTDTETGGTQPALFSPVLSNGTLTMAGGRVVQTADGKIRLVQFADDALVVNCPRVQLWTAMIPPRKRYVHEFTFQVGDATTPCPAYDAGGKNNILVWQIKGSGSQPPIALNIRVMVDGTLRLDLNRKLTNTGTVFTAGTVLGLLPSTPIKVKLDFSPDWQIEAEGGTAFLALTVNDAPVELFDANATSDGYSSISSPTVFSDLSATYQVMVGMYRYDYAGVKAPNNCCLVIHKYILYRKNNT